MSFETVQSILANHSLSKFLVWLGLSFLTYHCIAGFRHLLMDYSGFGEEKDSGSQIAYAFLLFSLITSFIIGYWLW
jgi:succinate dehydrogenase / fumarate reductase cytochrome b subunit